MDENKTKKLVTHNGSFHADDVFATATIQMVLDKKGEKYEVIRTRDEELIKNADFVYDVGGIYDESTNRFDHHQKGGAGKDEYGIEYSSFGLVWEKFGEELCGSKDGVKIIRNKLVAPIDGPDNGMDIIQNKYEDISPYTIQDYFFSTQPTWKEKDENIDEIFLQCVLLAKNILKREITIVKDFIEGEEAVKKIYNQTEDKRVIIYDDHYPMDNVLYKLPEVLFIIYPRPDTKWAVRAVRKHPRTFENRKNLPDTWGGLRDEELAKVSGVSDAVFCHRALFLAVANSKEGAMKLAELALES